MKANKIFYVVLMYISHIYIYSSVYMILYNLIRYIKADFFILKDFSGMVLLSPLSMMFIDGILIFLNLLSPVIFFIILHYKKNSNYFMGNMYSGELFGDMNILDLESWEEQALLHLEGSQEMFNRRKNVYGI